MKFEQHYLECLSQASYLIGDEQSGVAAVVDPRRDVEVYLDSAAEQGLTIKYVIETHFHADFLSGHLELAAATGAEIIFGNAAEASYDIRRVRTGERIELGDPNDGVVLEFRETPGHTPESISVVIWEHGTDKEPFGVLTGDTMFIGDVGRPDLLASVGVTANELARDLYTSLHNQILTLPDSTKVFPAHGAGSACGKNLSTNTVSTIGHERETNYAVQPMEVDEFVAVVTEGQPSAPAYFGFNAGLNKRGHELLDTQPPSAMTLEEVLAAQNDGAIVIDTRSNTDFAAGHLTGSINVGLEGRFAEYVGSVVPAGTPIVLVSDPGTETEAKLRLARIGFDDVLGVLEGGTTQFITAPESTQRASRLNAAELNDAIASTDVQVIDIRNSGETALGTIAGAVILPLARLREKANTIDFEKPLVVYCAGGYRSSIAASMLRSLGAKDVSDLLGGYDAWRQSIASTS